MGMEQIIFCDTSCTKQFSTPQGKSQDITLFLLAKSKIHCQLDLFLDAPQSSLQVAVFILALPGSNVSLVTRQLHSARSAKSRMDVKSVVGEDASVVYNGFISVGVKAHSTDAYERNASLLLGSRSRALSSPVLEIETNDVHASHGSVTSMPSRDELWYLQTRGIAPSDALRLLVTGYVGSGDGLAPQNARRWNGGLGVITRSL